MNKKHFNLFVRIFCAAILFVVMLLYVINSKRYAQATLIGLKLWATTVLPSLLPFFFFTALFTATGVSVLFIKAFKRPAKILFNADGILIYIRIMSLISGYPVGAKIISDLYLGGVISKEQAKKYALSTSTSGPIYVVGTVAISLFNSPKLGAVLLISHYLSSLLNGIIFRKLPDNGLIAPLLQNKADSVLYNAMFNAVTTLTVLGGFIAVFYTLSQLALDYNILSPFIKVLSPVYGDELSRALVLGLIECTSGCKAISALPLTDKAVCTAAQIIAFGGVSVWCQTMAYLKKANVSFLWFAISKIVQTITVYPICYILLKAV